VNPTKRYLLKYFAVYIVIGLIANFILGPPGYSRAFQEKFKQELEYYKEITRSEPYILWKQRPELHHLDEVLEKQIAFVQSFEDHSAFKEEQRRRMYYQLFFEAFATIMLVVLLSRFGRKPLLNFLDQKISEVRDWVQTAQRTRTEAAEQKKAAEEKLRSLPEEKEQIDSQTAGSIEQQQAEIDKALNTTLEQIENETRDRKQEEQHAAARVLKEELVSASIDLLIKKYRAEASGESEANLVNRFIADLEARS